MRRVTMGSAGLGVVLALSGAGAGQDRDAPPREVADLIATLPWRSIGPTNMGGRVTDVAVVEAHPQVFYVGLATGGIYRTVNNGTTFDPVFDGAGLASVGDLAVAPSDPQTLWVGTGEANPRNSVSWGDGVWKSTNGGTTWHHRGLAATGAIGRIRIHPTDPDTVWVAAAGNTWTDDPTRGLYKTTDGGETWTRVLAPAPGTGVVDVVLHPDDPDTLLAAAYERRRDAHDGNDPAVRWGPGSALYKSRDGGRTWRALSGPDVARGLPTVALGRIGLDWCRSAPEVVYAVVESEWIGRLLEGGQPPKLTGRPYIGVRSEPADGGGVVLAQVIPRSGAAAAGLQAGDVLLELDGRPVTGPEALTEIRDAHQAGDTVTIRWRREGIEHTGPLTFGAQGRSPDPKNPWRGPLGGQIAGGEELQGPDGWQQGGIYRSDDAGEHWHRVSSLNQRPFYFSQLRVNPSDPQDVWHLGIQCWRSRDGGATWKSVGGGSHVDYHACWIDPRDGDHVLLGSDGGCYVAWDGRTWDHLNQVPMGQFYGVALDNRTPYHVYGGLQDNGSWGGPSRVRSTAGATQSDWRMLLGGDGFRCVVDPTDDGCVYAESQYGRIVRLNLRSGRADLLRRPPRVDWRFNWNTPFVLSPHDHRRVWVGADRLCTAEGGDITLRAVSAPLTRTEAGTLTAVAEDRRTAGRLYVGSDDGALQVSMDNGATWTDRAAALPGVGGPRHVAAIEPSWHAPGVVYVALDGHRSGDLAPHLFESRDGGASFARITAGLPAGVPVRVVREDPHVPGLLYAGTETGVFVRPPGGVWRALGGLLPVVPVFDLQVHARDRELVAGTHGRSLYICDVAPLEEAVRADGLKDAVTLLGASHPVVALEPEPRGRLAGVRHFSVENPPPCRLWMHLPVVPAEGVELAVEVRNAEGQALRSWKAPRGGWRRGWTRIDWDLRAQPRRGGRPVRGPGAPVGPGTYRVVVRVTGRELAAADVTVQADPGDDPALYRRKPGNYEEWLLEEQRAGGWKGQ